MTDCEQNSNSFFQSTTIYCAPYFKVVHINGSSKFSINDIRLVLGVVSHKAADNNIGNSPHKQQCQRQASPGLDVCTWLSTLRVITFHRCFGWRMSVKVNEFQCASVDSSSLIYMRLCEVREVKFVKDGAARLSLSISAVQRKKICYLGQSLWKYTNL